MIVAILDTLPFKSIVIPFFVLVMLIFQATSIDSNAYTMAMIGCKSIRDTQEPPKWSRLWWAGMLLFVTVALISVGGMTVVQLSSVLTSVPILFIIIILAFSTVKWLNEDFGERCKAPILVADYKDVEETEPPLVERPQKTQNI